MDGSRFDDIIRTAAISRRKALKLALGGAIAALAPQAHAHAARRGFPAPTNPFNPPAPTCRIGDAAIPANTVNPDNICQRCDPALEPNGWSPVPGAFCGDGNQVCCDGGCCPATHCCGLDETCTPCRCQIGDELIPDGTPHPTSDCLVCTPALSTTAWSPVPERTTCGGVPGRVCCNGECCAPTECCAGAIACEECGPHCLIGDQDIPAGTINPNDDCEVCAPERSIDTWSNAIDGTECDGGCCTGGLCGACSCTIDEKPIPDGEHNPRNDCEACNYNANPTDWTTRSNGASCGTNRDCCDGECCPEGQCCTLDGCELCCHIGSDPVADGVVNPRQTCQVCDARRDFSDWTILDNGEACGIQGNAECCNGECCPAGQCCRNGACALCDCKIGTRSVAPDTINEDNPCEICKPALNRFGWSPVASGIACDDDGGTCCGGECCSSEQCCLLDACGECLCSIDNVIIEPQDHNDANDCELCDPHANPFGWTKRDNNERCEGSRRCCNGHCCDDGLCCIEGACQDCGCLIGDQIVTPGTLEPGNDCRICDPERSLDDWSPRDEGAECGDSPAQCCTSGTCVICSCLIDDQPVKDGDPNPLNECQHCDLALDPSNWSPRNETFSCGAGGVCCNGVCCPAGNTCNLNDICEPAGCVIDGVPYSPGTPNPRDRCQHCNPLQPNVWSPRAVVDCPPPCEIGGQILSYGTPNPENPCQVCRGGTDWSPSQEIVCGDGSQRCCQGACCEPGACCSEAGLCAFDACQPQGCVIDGVEYPDGTTNPANACQFCSLATSATSWTPQFGACGPTGEQFCCAGVCCDLGACCNSSDVCAFDACETCVIDGQLWFPEDRNPANGCEMCIANANKFAWTPLPDFSWCDEMQLTTCCSGSCCPPGEQCAGGSCQPV